MTKSANIPLLDVVTEYGFKEKTLRDWGYNATKNPAFPLSFRIGRRVYYDRTEIEAYVANQKAEARTARDARTSNINRPLYAVAS